MSLRRLNKAEAPRLPQNYQWDARSDVLECWAAMPQAAEADDANTISIFDVIGEDPLFGGGFTARRMAGALRSIGNKPVSVRINSPGGDMFEGIAIRNLLAEHPAKVTVSVIGLAASAASVIAMAGDEIRMGLGTFMMVHNAWGLVIGNRNDMREAADLFEQFDNALVDIYADRTGLSRDDIETIMNAETFMGPKEAIDKGFADQLDESMTADGEANNALSQEVIAIRRVDAALAKQGFPRSERRTLLREVKNGTHDAAASVTHDADGVTAADFTRLMTAITP
ncbi:MAG TPA: head maturation protease, ClpP-related [Alphaproteobacteria bacterium]|nr:head maturation protease, ClpP-related [Alphaproteobacteria bacterium]